MRLLILGLLMECNRHPYEIRQTIKERNWHHTFKIRDGSLYYAVDQLRVDGLIEASEIIPSAGDNRPDKKVYRITEKGRAAFLALLYGQFRQDHYPQHPMFIGLPFAWHADNARLEEIVAERLEACETRLQHVEAVLQLKGSWLPRGAVLFIQGIVRFSEAERDWLLDVLAEARSGKLTAGKAAPPPTK